MPQAEYQNVRSTSFIATLYLRSVSHQICREKQRQNENGRSKHSARGRIGQNLFNWEGIAVRVQRQSDVTSCVKETAGVAPSFFFFVPNCPFRVVIRKYWKVLQSQCNIIAIGKYRLLSLCASSYLIPSSSLPTVGTLSSFSLSTSPSFL